MKERYKSGSFTTIELDDIDTEYSIHTFDEFIDKFNCIHHYIQNIPLKPLQKKELYCMAVSWMHSNLKEEDKEKIAEILPLDMIKIEQLEDGVVECLFPLLEKYLIQHAITWHLLDQTMASLEKELLTLISRGRNYQYLQSRMQNTRSLFISNAKKLLQNLLTGPTVINKRIWIDTYVRMMGKYFEVWFGSIIPLKDPCDPNFYIDLTHLDLRELNLSNIPLKQANLTHSCLAGSQLSGTRISAVQLSKAREFAQIVDIQPELRADAQNKYFQHWQGRLAERTQQFEKIGNPIHHTSFNGTENVGTFEVTIRQYEQLMGNKRRISKYLVAHAVEPGLLDDLRIEQKNAINLRIAELEEKENALRDKLDKRVHETLCTLM